MPPSLLESLPTELILHLTSFIPSHSTSIRPRNSLLALSQSSRHLYSILLPSINEDLQFDTKDQLDTLLSITRDSRPSWLLDRHVRRIALRPRTSESYRRHVSWSVTALKEVIELAQDCEVRELVLAGVDINSVYEALARTSVPTRTSLKRLRIEFVREVDLDSSGIVASGLSAYRSNSTAIRNGGTTPMDATSHDQLLRAIFTLYPNLHSLSVVNLADSISSRPSSRSSSSLTPDLAFATYKASLLHLHLENSTISPSTITNLLSSCYSTLDKFELVHCSDALLEDEALIEQLCRCERMKELKLVSSSDIRTSSGGTSTAPNSPELVLATKKKGMDGRTSPYLSRRRLSSGKEMDLPLLDRIIPSFPHLKHLVAHPLHLHSTPLYSNELFHRLSTLTPRLRSLSLSLTNSLSHTDSVRPSSLLPLFRSESPLTSLRHLEIISPSVELASTSSTIAARWNEEIRDLWGAAVDKDVGLGGNLWKDAVGKWVEWAEREEERREGEGSEVVMQAGEGTRRRRAGRKVRMV